MKHNVKQIVISTFEKNMDLCLSDYENVALKDLELDSLGFVSFIVDLENSLSINIPEEFLIIDELHSALWARRQFAVFPAVQSMAKRKSN